MLHFRPYGRRVGAGKRTPIGNGQVVKNRAWWFPAERYVREQNYRFNVELDPMIARDVLGLDRRH